MLFTLTFQGIYVYTNNIETEGLASYRWACLRQIYIGRRRKRTVIPCCPKHLNLDMLATEGNIMMLPPVSATAVYSNFRVLSQAIRF